MAERKPIVKEVKVSRDEFIYDTSVNPLEGLGVSEKEHRRLTKKLTRRLKGKKGTKEALRFSKVKGVKVIEKKGMPRYVGGYVKNNKTVIVNKNMPEGEKFWSTTHELEHIKKKDKLDVSKARAIIDSIKLVEARRERATKKQVKRYLGENWGKKVSKVIVNKKRKQKLKKRTSK